MAREFKIALDISSIVACNSSTNGVFVLGDSISEFFVFSGAVGQPYPETIWKLSLNNSLLYSSEE